MSRLLSIVGAAVLVAVPTTFLPVWLLGDAEPAVTAAITAAVTTVVATRSLSDRRSAGPAAGAPAPAPTSRAGT